MARPEETAHPPPSSKPAIATEQIEGFIATYDTYMAHPYEWKKGVRFYKRLKAKIAARSELQLAA